MNYFAQEKHVFALFIVENVAKNAKELAWCTVAILVVRKCTRPTVYKH